MSVAQLGPEVLDGFGYRIAKCSDEQEGQAGEQKIRHQGCVGIELECLQGGIQMLEKQVEREAQARDTGADLGQADHQWGDGCSLSTVAALVTVRRVRFVQTRHRVHQALAATNAYVHGGFAIEAHHPVLVIIDSVPIVP